MCMNNVLYFRPFQFFQLKINEQPKKSKKHEIIQLQVICMKFIMNAAQYNATHIPQQLE